jgi:hypothetical protein
VPVLIVLPVSLVALAVFWFVIRFVWDVSYTWFAVGYLAGAVLLFVRPIQTVLLTRLLGARPPTREERVRLDTAWRSVLQAARLPRHRSTAAVEAARRWRL